MNPVAQIRGINDPKVGHYDAIVFWCPGCEQPTEDGIEMQGGLHMLPVNSAVKTPQWTWDGNLDAPTLSPSILTSMAHARRRSAPGEPLVDVGQFTCHSFIRGGQIEFLSDCTHALAGQTVPLPPLPDWCVREV